MRYNAKVTSKGQITIPVEVRRALDLEPGASVAFEVAGEHATVTRARPISEVAAEIRLKYPLGPRRYATDREGIEAAVREHWAAQELGQGWIVHSGRPAVPLADPDDLS